MIRDLISKLCRALAVRIVRLLPFIFLLVVVIYYIELLYSANNYIYTEFLDENGCVYLIVYDTKIFDSINAILGVSFASIIPLFILSQRMSFCLWHRIPQYYLFANTIITNALYNNITFEYVQSICIFSLISIAFVIMLSTYLYIKHGDRKKGSL